jgi:type III pantothenate kinase
MANLVIDIGNTCTKLAVFEHDELRFAENYKETDIEVLNHLLEDFAIGTAIISSVKKDSGKWETVLKERTALIYFNTEMTAGISNHYLTPKTLGPDRLAAVIGASHLYPGKNSLVIDGGTCITYDYIDAKANYAGGSISPGLYMRYNALNNYTAVLPLLKPDDAFNAAYGSDTRGAILSGVQNGIKYELTGFIEGYRQHENELNIILTGGDSIFFDRLLKNSIFAPYIKIEPHLVLKGLNAAIQQHND